MVGWKNYWRENGIYTRGRVLLCMCSPRCDKNDSCGYSREPQQKKPLEGDWKPRFKKSSRKPPINCSLFVYFCRFLLYEVSSFCFFFPRPSLFLAVCNISCLLCPAQHEKHNQKFPPVYPFFAVDAQQDDNCAKKYIGVIFMTYFPPPRMFLPIIQSWKYF